jgi:hypothetical protein
VESSAGVALGVDGSLALNDLPLLGSQSGGDGRETVDGQHLAVDNVLRGLSEGLGERNTTVSNVGKGLGSSLAVGDSWGSLRAELEQTGHGLLIEKGGLGVCSSVVSLPVGVLGNVVGGVRGGILVDIGLGSRTGGGDSIERHNGVTGRSVRGNSQENSELLPDTLRADCVFLG